MLTSLGSFGFKTRLEKNERSPIDEDIASDESAVRVLIVQAQEDWAIAYYKCGLEPVKNNP
ncbi:hypothetical protein H6F50_09245 [Coleofasciculus sp. FACHB-712]|uniref:hypothetical protein n=1 Tax=Cyanophyceae TaxID=3028117 RepID=UPI001687EB19|nr:hypothetical protein [Coleofasciculus sp. FACHB-712]MBD1942539.1 hypothetical protein [Coleofasciculus sp. FACHB-712]